MDYRVEWMEILMVLGSAVGGVFTVLLYAMTRNLASLWMFPLGLSGGAFLGLFIDKVIAGQK